MKMEQKNVWDRIAESWHGFRQRPTEIAEKLAKEWKAGKILDIGCGNCRNLLPFSKQGFQCYGVDFSDEMLRVASNFCRKNDMYVELRKAEMTKLPFSSWQFDYCLNIDVLHNLRTEDARKIALFEMRRVMKPSALALITVWNRLQPRFLHKIFFSDTYIPWRVEGKKYYRYYHLFTYWELKKLIEKCGFLIVRSSGLFGRKLFFIVGK